MPLPKKARIPAFQIRPGNSLNQSAAAGQPDPLISLRNWKSGKSVRDSSAFSRLGCAKLPGIAAYGFPRGSLIYNAPYAYADLIRNGRPVTHLKTVTMYQPFVTESYRRPRDCSHGRRYLFLFTVNPYTLARNRPFCRCGKYPEMFWRMVSGIYPYDGLCENAAENQAHLRQS